MVIRRLSLTTTFQRTRSIGTSLKHQEFFGALGVTNIQTFVDPKNPSHVALMLDVPDMEAVAGALQGKAAADAMTHDGVVPESL